MWDQLTILRGELERMEATIAGTKLSELHNLVGILQEFGYSEVLKLPLFQKEVLIGMTFLT